MHSWVGDPQNPGVAYVRVDYEGIAGVPSPWYDAVPRALGDQPSDAHIGSPSQDLTQSEVSPTLGRPK